MYKNYVLKSAARQSYDSARGISAKGQTRMAVSSYDTI
jgi:hypothetical protein